MQMNNSNALKSIALSYNTLFKNNKLFVEFREAIDSKQTNDLFSQEQVREVEKAYRARAMELERFSKELDKFEKFMPPEMYQSFKKAISNELFAIGNLMGTVHGFLELGDEGLLDDITEKFDGEKETGLTLAKEMESFTNNLAFNLLFQVTIGNLTLEDLKLMSLAFEQDSVLVDKINHVIEILENEENLKLIPPRLAERLGIEQPGEKKAEATDAAVTPPSEEPVEEAEIEQSISVAPVATQDAVTVDAKTAVDEPALSEVQQTPERKPEKKQSLQERLNAVNYKMNGNINTEVQEISVETRLEKVGAEIAQLQGKDKRTIRDSFRLSQLLEEQVELQAYSTTIDGQKLTRAEQRRDKGLQTTSDKIMNTESQLAEAKEIGDQYESNIMRFLSARYQQKLSTRIQRLQEKKGNLTELQVSSSVARFDKESGKIARRSRRKGNIAQLKAYRDQILNEIESLGNDMIRFSSITNEKMQKMKSGKVVMLDKIPTLSEAQAELTAEVTMAA